METMAQEWIEEGKKEGIDIGKKEGIDIGKKEGIEQGKLIAQRQTLLQLLQFRFPSTVEERERYITYLAQIHDINSFTQLVNQLLIAPALAEFEQKLISYLPKDEEQK